ncbi:MAG: fatty acid desaturase [Candidatus Paceibacterota bacterium]
MSVIDFLIHGFLDWSSWWIVLYTLVTTHITIVSVTIYLHRSQAHIALKLQAVPEHFFRFWLWVHTGMLTKVWQSIHRKHHAKCETEEDPHSPVAHGIKKVFWQGAELYRAEAKNEETMIRYGYGAPYDWLERNLYSRYPKLGVTILLFINVFLFGVLGLTVWAVQMAWIPVLAAGVVNGVGHYWGQRTFSPPDESRNIFPLGILIGGEELHNNHHTYPASAKLSVEWYEFDIGWLYIRFLELLRLAKVNRKHLAPRVQIAHHTNTPEETVRVVVVMRFELLRQFDALVKDVPATSRELVQQLRKELTSLWEDKTLTVETRLERFSDWCLKARSSGVLWLDGLVSLLPYWRVVRG